MYEYTHGGDIYDENGLVKENMTDFSASINPLGMPEGAVSAAKRALENSNVYPDSDCRLLKAKLAEFESADKSNIFCMAGASDILFRLCYAVKPKKALVAAPSFSDYERAGRAAGAEIIYYTRKKENNFDIEKDIAQLIFSALPDIVFICNPNNPTGNLTDMGLLEEMASACEAAGSVLLVDECFLDFAENSRACSAKALIESRKNVIVLKAFTKIFAMPGLRLGYAICGDTALISRMRFCGPDWAVSNVAGAAGAAALEYAGEYIKNTREYVKKERGYISGELRRAGMTVYPAHANFIFFYCPRQIDLYGELKKRGIVIRDCANFAGLGPGYYRCAVLTREKNRLFVNALKEV
ncbi:MAG: aminotransferase class I/II-fold pyridoxal phosphate-dependent enzyme [Oscillospiraceae bacterium]|nr:aminotransferase class I/II-fold pyridoxal phosphate-dependent enzyme [Oscillospiraceae bacterium]